MIIEGYEGTVEQINIRCTQIRTYQGERILLPNSTVFTIAVQVRTAYEHRRTDLGVGIDYNTSLPEVAELLQHTIMGVDGVVSTPAPEIDLVSFGDSSIILSCGTGHYRRKNRCAKSKQKRLLQSKKLLIKQRLTSPTQFARFISMTSNGLMIILPLQWILNPVESSSICR